MITNKVKIIEVKKDHLEVSPMLEKSCKNCQSADNCGIWILNNFFTKKRKKFKIFKKISQKDKIGKIIDVEISEKELLNKTIKAYLLPIICAISVATLVNLIHTNDINTLFGLVFGLFLPKAVSYIKNFGEPNEGS
jgi:positive regulator of sigma E activity